MPSPLATARRLVPLALATTLAACGARPNPPVGNSAHRLTAGGTPTAAALGFWRFYSIERGPRDDDTCRLDPRAVPAALRGQPITSTMLFDADRVVPAPDVIAEQVFCMHTTTVARDRVSTLPDDIAPIEWRPPRVSTLAAPAIKQAAPAIKQAAAARFARRAGALARSVQSGPVRVAVLDTAAPGAPGLGAVAPHGEDMALLIRGAVCPDNPRGCPVEVVTDVALDLDTDAAGLRLSPDGGRFGDPGIVARAIHRAVDRAARDDVPLVINLSLGWLDDGDERVSVQAARLAIEQARDRGAVVVAAAGNDDDGAVDRAVGLMLPARWSTVAHADGRPLVLSVGGVGADDAPLANARAYADTPPSAWAYGAHAPADARYLTPDAQRPRLDGAMWTGSSVAAAVASASSATILGQGQPAVEVLEVLTQVGEPLRICAIVGQPCARATARMPDLASVRARRLGPMQTRSIAACGGLAHGFSARPDEACPSAVIDNPIASPRVDPQPEFPGCEVCGYDATSGKLVVKLSADTTALTLRVDAPSGDTEWISLDAGLLAGEQRSYALQLQGFKALSVVGKVTVSGKTTVFEDPVMVWSTP